MKNITIIGISILLILPAFSIFASKAQGHAARHPSQVVKVLTKSWQRHCHKKPAGPGWVCHAHYKQHTKIIRYNWTVTKIIHHVFGSYGGQAVSVAQCESSLSTGATNGQYLGLFQMGSNERATYGHGSDAWSQTIGAYRYFVASGRDWSPWACKP